MANNLVRHPKILEVPDKRRQNKYQTSSISFPAFTMTSDSLKKMQEKLFRTPGDSTPRPQIDEARESLAGLPGLTINIPKPPTFQMPPPKVIIKGSESSPQRGSSSPPSISYRERLAQRLAGDYDGAERFRLLEDEKRERHWKKWGPYLSDRQWVCRTLYEI